MKHFLLFPVAVTLMVANIVAHAEKNSSCSQIKEKDKRLRCFDREFPATAATPKSTISVASASGLAINSPVGAVSAKRATNMPPLSEKKKESELSTSSLFDWQKRIEVESHITAIRSGRQQKAVFRLGNGQIWMQSTPRDLPFRIGDKVMIKSGRVGGYIMRSETGTSTRVTFVN